MLKACITVFRSWLNFARDKKIRDTSRQTLNQKRDPLLLSSDGGWLHRFRFEL